MNVAIRHVSAPLRIMPQSVAAAPQLVDLSRTIPGLRVDLRYATADNFFGRRLYPTNARPLTLPDTAKRLTKAQQLLEAQGFRLLIWDAYRPLSVQKEMWRQFPDPRYVADPAKGSNHNRASAVDVSLVTLDGSPVEMPTPFDTFSEAAHHGYQGGTETSRRNREILRKAMVDAGMIQLSTEWWHYSIPGARDLPILDVPLEPR